MKLTKFKVTNFRSVDDSGWIEVDAVTALIGVNESGKTKGIIYKSAKKCLTGYGTFL